MTAFATAAIVTANALNCPEAACRSAILCEHACALKTTVPGSAETADNLQPRTSEEMAAKFRAVLKADRFRDTHDLMIKVICNISVAGDKRLSDILADGLIRNIAEVTASVALALKAKGQ